MWPWPAHNKQPIRTQILHHHQAFSPSNLPGSTESTWRNKKGKTVRDGNEATGLKWALGLGRLIDFAALSLASRYTWICTSGYMESLIYSLILCQHPAVLSRPSLLNINNSWLTLILCNSTIVSGQGSIKFSSLSSFQLSGMLNISCHRPPGQVSVWLDERFRRTACRCPRKANQAVQWCSKNPFGVYFSSFLVMNSNSVVFFNIEE